MKLIDEHDDDKPIGRILTRREILRLLGGSGAALVVGAGFTRLGIEPLALTPTLTAIPESTALPGCVVRPAKTEGPYFVDDQLNRVDIRVEPSDGSIKEGALLHLLFRVLQVSDNGCVPLAGAQIDLWHCDAAGAYSGVSDPGFDTSDQKWLRGYQITDENGHAEFITIYPGWYSGRTVHMHFKIRTDPDAEAGYEFTSQLFFDEDLTDIVHAQAPYAAKGYRDTLNETDNIYQENGDLLLLAITENEAGYQATFDIALDLSQPSESTDEAPGMGGPGGAPRGTPPSGGLPPRATATPTPG